jgi:asparagine synthase (glutamine-hydrolysing)
MCGIAGLVLGQNCSDDQLRQRVKAMNAAIAHRGPDGDGIWTEANAGVALAHRRLAIVDLSETGAQPMVSGSGRFVITYNGEIYNFPVLRKQLETEDVIFRGGSDTEVLLNAWERWGAARTLSTLNGMFAFAIWDRQERCLTLARDHFGIKPLVWRHSPEGVFFASELKALLRDPSCPRDIDPASVAAYLRHGNVPAPWTIFANIQKLEPGSMLTWRPGEAPSITQYWSPVSAAVEGENNPYTLPFDRLVDHGEALIGDAVGQQLMGDVPLGAFLSGGIDSSLVSALMQQRVGNKIDTFTIGFSEPAWDESSHASAVASHLGTRHHTLMTSGDEALSLVDEIAGIYDEPFADSSQLPTLLLSRLVRKHVSVALSGDGGDEVFAGYERYGWGLKLAQYQDRVPSLLRQSAATIAGHLPTGFINTLLRASGSHRNNIGHKAQRAAALGAAGDFVSGYRQFLSQTNDPSVFLRTPGEHQPAAYAKETTNSIRSSLVRMQVIDALSYLPDDILVKVDRASMSTGLEVRVPLLDHRIWTWASRISPQDRRAGANGKSLLRAVLKRHVPEALFSRPKAGFAVPLASWLRLELRPLAEGLLEPSRLEQAGIFNVSAVRKIWTSHLDGSQDHAPLLWSILIFESWRRGLSA